MKTFYDSIDVFKFLYDTVAKCNINVTKNTTLYRVYLDLWRTIDHISSRCNFKKYAFLNFRKFASKYAMFTKWGSLNVCVADIKITLLCGSY